MSVKHCKTDCDFFKTDTTFNPRCIVYDKALKIDGGGVKRLKKCVRDSNAYKIRNQISDISLFYDAFVLEMDLMLNNLNELMKEMDRK